MRKLIFLGLSLLVVEAHAICSQKINPKRVVVFINTNGSFLEADAAEKAACARGEGFILHPPMNAAMRKYREADLAFAYASEKLNHCKKNCDQLKKEASKLLDQKYIALSATPEVTAKSVENELKQLAKAGIATSSLVISGHDGGGSIGGTQGNLDKFQATTAFKNAYAARPDLQKELTSVLLWGCYTSTPSEVLYWKSTLPQLKIVGGFYGAGPSNIRKSSYDLMSDLLMKEKNIVNKANMTAVKSALTSLDQINNTWAGLYAQCSDGEYYLGNSEKGRTFKRFNDFRDCKHIQKVAYEMEAEFNPYFFGSKDVPTNTNGALRDIYNFSRQNSQCLDRDSNMNADRVGLLLFFNGVKKNFAQTFKKDLLAAQKELSTLDEKIEDYSNDKVGTMDSIKEFFGSDLPIRSEMKDLKKTYEGIQKNLTRLFNPSTVGSMSRPEILRTITSMNAFYNHSTFRNHPKLLNKFPSFKKVEKLMEKYLNNLSPNCMDMLEWHEYKPGKIAKPRC